jgi:outer membrane protein TolC
VAILPAFALQVMADDAGSVEPAAVSESSDSQNLLTDESVVVPEIFSLDDAVSWALTHNREIERLQLEVDAAQAALDGADRLYYPSLDFTGNARSAGPASSIDISLPGGFDFSKEISTTDVITTGLLTLSQPVCMFGAFSLAQEIAQLRLDQASLQLQRARETVRRDVEEAFLNAALAKELIDVATRAVETADERLRIAQARFEAGDVAQFEVLRAQVNVATRREELIRAETASSLAMSALVQKLGMDSGTEIEIAPPDVGNIDVSEPDMTLIDALAAAVENRKDIKALDVAVNILDVSVDLNRNRPALVFQGNYSYSDRTVGFSANKEAWSLILNFSYNLYDGGRTESSVDEARANRDALDVLLADTRTLVQLDVQSAYLAVSDAVQQVEMTTSALESAREALRIAELGYAEGVIPYIDYQDADLGLMQAETFHVKALYGYLTAMSRLHAAIGEG